MNMEECLICVEPFTRKRRSIKCEYCDFTACKACITKWILEETKPKCRIMIVTVNGHKIFM